LITKSLETTDNVIINKMVVLENIIDEVSSAVPLIEENNSHEDLLVVMKNRYLNLRCCTLLSVKGFGSYHGIKKRMSVADGTVDITVQYKEPYRR